MKLRFGLFLVLIQYFALAHSACPTWSTGIRFMLNSSEITDRRTGLVWSRCSIGQAWNGINCAGTANTYTQESAFQFAATQSGWRLPNRRELFSLADKGCKGPAIDTTAFPNTLLGPYWTSSPDVGLPAAAWYVDFNEGFIRSFGYGIGRSERLPVRLVRSSQ